MTQEGMYHEHKRLVYLVLKQKFPGSFLDEDCAQAGKLGLWKACLTYDESQGKFSSYAYVCIFNEIAMTLRPFCKPYKYGYTVISKDAYIAQDGNRELTVEDVIQDPAGQDFETKLMYSDFIERVYKHLTELQKFVIEHYLMGETQIKISESAGVSQSYVSRVIKQVQRIFLNNWRRWCQ